MGVHSYRVRVERREVVVGDITDLLIFLSPWEWTNILHLSITHHAFVLQNAGCLNSMYLTVAAPQQVFARKISPEHFTSIACKALSLSHT